MSLAFQRFHVAVVAAELSSLKIMQVKIWLALFIIDLDLAAVEIGELDVTPSRYWRCRGQNVIGDWLSLFPSLFCGRLLQA